MTGPARVWLTVTGLVTLHFLIHLGLGIGAAAPDLLTVALLVGVRETGPGPAAGLGFFLGLLEDAFSVLAFGANTVAATVVGAVGALTRDLFVGDSLIFLVSYFFIGKWAKDLLHWVLLGEGMREPFVQAVAVDGAVAAVYAMLAGLVAMTISGASWEARR